MPSSDNVETADQPVNNDIVISFSCVQKGISRLDISQSQGPDCVHPKLLKSSADNHDLPMEGGSYFSLFKKGCTKGIL